MICRPSLYQHECASCRRIWEGAPEPNPLIRSDLKPELILNGTVTGTVISVHAEEILVQKETAEVLADQEGKYGADDPD